MKRLRHVRFPLLCATLGACALTATAITVHRPAEVSDPCRIAADFAKRSCFHEALEELWLTRANCQNLPQPQRVQCMLDAHDHFTDALDECSQQKEARVDLCERLGGGAYHPVIDPEDFQSDIDNPLLPMVPGRTY